MQELFDRAGTDAFVFVFEPDLVMLRMRFELRDYSEMIFSGRVIFFQEDKAELFAQLHATPAAISMGFDPIVHAPARARASISSSSSDLDHRIRQLLSHDDRDARA